MAYSIGAANRALDVLALDDDRRDLPLSRKRVERRIVHVERDERRALGPALERLRGLRGLIRHRERLKSLQIPDHAMRSERSGDRWRNMGRKGNAPSLEFAHPGGSVQEMPLTQLRHGDGISCAKGCQVGVTPAATE